MALTKKHFEQIARDIKANHPDHYVIVSGGHSPEQQRAVKVTLSNLAHDLCVTFRAESPNFDGQRFLKACGF